MTRTVRTPTPMVSPTAALVGSVSIAAKSRAGGEETVAKTDQKADGDQEGVTPCDQQQCMHYFQQNDPQGHIKALQKGVHGNLLLPDGAAVHPACNPARIIRMTA